MIQIHSYLGFNGKCREAMNFYKDCFGGEVEFMTIGDSPEGERCPEGMRDQIMHASLTGKDFLLMGSDMTPPDGHKSGTDMSISLTFDSEKEIHDCFAKLSEGGKVIDPLSIKFWGSLFGVVIDKYGKPWMLSYDEPAK